MAPQPAIFLPGIIMPAELRYAPLVKALGDAVKPVVKNLEVYSGPEPPRGYSIQLEVEGVSRAADAAGFEQFHLYGHSGGGACALAYVSAHPERVITLAVDEPASDFSEEAREEMRQELDAISRMPENEQLRGFLSMQLAPGVEPPAPQPGPAPDWMALRPAGIDAFTGALHEHRVDPDAFRRFDRPVYYSYGDLSNATWQRMRDRLEKLFPDFTAELYEGFHHFQTSHQQDPQRVAGALTKLWSRA